jgi:hypothetical protein
MDELSRNDYAPVQWVTYKSNAMSLAVHTPCRESVCGHDDTDGSKLAFIDDHVMMLNIWLKHDMIFKKWKQLMVIINIPIHECYIDD